MMQPDDNVQGYVRPRSTRPQGWRAVRRGGTAYASTCGHEDGWLRKKLNKDTLAQVLIGLRNSDLPDRAQCIRTGREKQFFAGDQLVSRLSLVIGSTNDPKPIIEGHFDKLFEDFRAGELFEHCEIVMAILFALKSSNQTTFQDLSEAFIRSTAAEIGPIRRFAAELRGE